MRHRSDLSPPRMRLRRGAGPRDRATPPSRTRWPAALDRAARTGGVGPCPPQHHRPGDGRSAHRERGRAAADRRERRVLRLRADSARAGARGTPASDPLGQRDRAPPVRGRRPALPSPAPRRIRVRPVGRGAAADLRGTRPIRDQAAVLRVARRRALPRVRGKGPVRGRRPGQMESRGVIQCHGPGWPADRDAVRGRVAAAAGPLHARRPEWDADSPLLGLRLPAGGDVRPCRARTTSGPRSFERRSRTRSGFGCARTCRWGAI